MNKQASPFPELICCYKIRKKGGHPSLELMVLRGSAIPRELLALQLLPTQQQRAVATFSHFYYLHVSLIIRMERNDLVVLISVKSFEIIIS